MVGHNKKGQYRKRTSILTDIYHIQYRVTFRELLEGYGWRGGREIGRSITKDQYRESASILSDIYRILYRVTFRELFEGNGGKGVWSVTIKRASIERVLVYYQMYTIYYTGLHLEKYWKVLGWGGKGDWSVTIKRAIWSDY